MAAPNSQFPDGFGSQNPFFSPRKEAEEQNAFSIERQRLAKECEAIKEQYFREEAIRFQRYEADMRRELIDKYFSDKDIFGDKIVNQASVDGAMRGRSSIVESYADPVAYLKKKEASSKSAANTSAGKGKQDKQRMDYLTS